MTCNCRGTGEFLSMASVIGTSLIYSTEPLPSANSVDAFSKCSSVHIPIVDFICPFPEKFLRAFRQEQRLKWKFRPRKPRL